MRLSTVIELLLILLLVAFAAYGRVIDRDEISEIKHRAVRAAKIVSAFPGMSSISLKQATDSVNKYCTCNEIICNCCRDFHIPLVQLKGPGCASLQYMQEDNLAVQLSFGDNILTSTVVNGKSPKPVCVPLPGGHTKFCGRIYSIQRDANKHFKACLGLELQSATELEASLRVSCFRFGPDGLKLRPSEPLPVVEAEVSEEDDDDDDLFGLGSDEDEDEEEEAEDTPVGNSVPGSSDTSEEAEDADDDDEEDDDVLGLGALLDIITGEEDTTTKKPKATTQAPLLQFTIPLLNRPTSSDQFLEGHDQSTTEPLQHDLEAEDSETTEESELQDTATESEESYTDSPAEVVPNDEEEEIPENDEQLKKVTNQITPIVKPSKQTVNKVKKTTTTNKKPAITSSNINLIEDTEDKNKPVTKPINDDNEEDDDDDDILGADDLDDEDDDEETSQENEDDDEDDDEEDDDEDDDDEEDGDKIQNDKQPHQEQDQHKDTENDDDDEKSEELVSLDDDDDEDEDDEEVVLSALVDDEKEEAKKDVVNNHNASDEDDSDYDDGLSELLARNRHTRKLAQTPSNRQSRIMRL
ncbi:aspartic and glutamic acid-rich protein-like [Prorops nasuta]|uniref:aspartic and glutamic acid-rich protein-like n=1 Tax=Prorops nasuta TaxID=863751 RepID=UPI0034CEA43C